MLYSTNLLIFPLSGKRRGKPEGTCRSFLGRIILTDMTRYILLFSAILLLAGGASLFAAEDCGCTFQVDTRKGPQTLGGKSDHSSHEGLHKAVENSGTVVHVPH